MCLLLIDVEPVYLTTAVSVCVCVCVVGGRGEAVAVQPFHRQLATLREGIGPDDRRVPAVCAVPGRHRSAALSAPSQLGDAVRLPLRVLVEVEQPHVARLRWTSSLEETPERSQGLCTGTVIVVKMKKKQNHPHRHHYRHSNSLRHPTVNSDRCGDTRWGGRQEAERRHAAALGGRGGGSGLHRVQ